MAVSARQANEVVYDQRFFFNLERDGVKAVVDWCMANGFLADKYECFVCGGSMTLRERKEIRDRFHWVCRKTARGDNPHLVKRSVRKGSWFEESHLALSEILLLTVMWCKKATLEFIMDDLHLAKQTVTDWMSFCREVCADDLVRKSDIKVCGSESCHNMLGGKDVIVEIDESMFGKRKYNRGKRVNGKWVFGGVERGTNKCFARVVEKRSADVLLAVLNEYVLPGSLIISDCWKAYDCLSEEGFVHLTVNDSLTFKDPDTGAHTNSIEGTWGAIKRSLRGTNLMKGHFDAYLSEYMWRRRNAGNIIPAFFDAVKATSKPPGKDVEGAAAASEE